MSGFKVAVPEPNVEISILYIDNNPKRLWMTMGRSREIPIPNPPLFELVLELASTAHLISAAWSSPGQHPEQISHMVEAFSTFGRLHSG